MGVISEQDSSSWVKKRTEGLRAHLHPAFRLVCAPGGTDAFGRLRLGVLLDERAFEVFLRPGGLPPIGLPLGFEGASQRTSICDCLAMHGKHTLISDRIP